MHSDIIHQEFDDFNKQDVEDKMILIKDKVLRERTLKKRINSKLSKLSKDMTSPVNVKVLNIDGVTDIGVASLDNPKYIGMI
jgi:hypothetical protein